MAAIARRLAVLALSLAVLAPALCLPGYARATAGQEWAGKYENGIPISREELLEIIHHHELWAASDSSKANRDVYIERYMKWILLHGASEEDEMEDAYDTWIQTICAEGERANFSFTNLSGVDLSGRVLTGADFTQVQLQNSNLYKAHLYSSRLSNVNFHNARMSHINLSYSHLEDVQMKNTRLMGAKFNSSLLVGTQMTDAILEEADFSDAWIIACKFDGADLTHATISNAKFYDVWLNGTIYAPFGEPDKTYLSELKGLSEMRCDTSLLSGPTKLRNALREAGLRESEREVTYAIERARTAVAPFWEKWFRTVLFDWPSAYGMKPGRSLWIMWGFLLAFIPFYWLALWQGWGQRPAPAGGAPARKTRPLPRALALAAVLSLAGAGLYVGLDALMGMPLNRDNWHPAAILLGLLFPAYGLALWRAGCSNRKTGWPPLPHPELPAPPSLFRVIPGALLPGLASAALFVFPACECVDGGWPVRARVLCIFFLAVQPVFWVALCRRGCGDGIHQDWSKTRMRLDLGGAAPVLLQRPFLPAGAWAAYFSLLSAFNLGFREINVGNWIARIQPREFGLRASGWVRFVSGAQSLLSFYLLALWVLTYFGRPFE